MQLFYIVKILGWYMTQMQTFDWTSICEGLKKLYTTIHVFMSFVDYLYIQLLHAHIYHTQIILFGYNLPSLIGLQHTPGHCSNSSNNTPVDSVTPDASPACSILMVHYFLISYVEPWSSMQKSSLAVEDSLNTGMIYESKIYYNTKTQYNQA